MVVFQVLVVSNMQGIKETFRWYGPNDPVTLRDIKQCGCKGVMTALHQIPYGEVWSREAIIQRKRELAAYDLTWTAVESVPVSEAIKTGTGDYRRHIENYQQTIRNLGAEGVEVVIYNFMPVLDWIRTDLAYKLEDGSECLHFDPIRFAAFELYLLQRKGAENDYSSEQIEHAKVFFESMSNAEVRTFESSLIDVFPGVSFHYTIQDVRNMLATYDNIDRQQLLRNLKFFLEAVIPVCEEVGVRMAVHPDDPPRPLLGLPRIVSCEEDIRAILTMVDSPANGLCFCTGSFSARPDNDLNGMILRWGHRIHALHLRSTQCNADGSFYEANHLEGSVDMYAVVSNLLNEMNRRKQAGRTDWQLAFRPDHGHTMLDDLKKPPVPNPGYTCIGRMRGLAEIRGLQLGILRSKFTETSPY